VVAKVPGSAEELDGYLDRVLTVGSLEDMGLDARAKQASAFSSQKR
jgi:hypothetical protein